MTDTDPQTEAVYRRMLMARSPEDRFMMGVRMCEMARKTVLASLPPGLGPLERKIALLHRYYASDFSDGELAKIEAAIRSADMKNPAAAGEVSLRAGGCGLRGPSCTRSHAAKHSFGETCVPK